MKDEIEEKKNDVFKDINQKETLVKAEQELNNSMYFYHNIVEKLENDNCCFNCKKGLKDAKKKDKENISFVMPVRTCDKGLAVFASICNECFKKEQEKTKDKKEE